MTERPAEPVMRFLFEPYEKYYDNIKFIHKPAELLVKYAKLDIGQRVLDVACGTGLATILAAKVVGDTGKIIGVDIDENFLRVAMEKSASAGLSNIEYRVGNAEALEFNDASFDAVICASSIFLLMDIPKALDEWRRILKAGGIIAFNSWGERFLQPILKPLGECLSRYDGQPPPVPFFINKTDTPDKCRELLKRAGFDDIDITAEQLDCQYKDKTDYWQEIGLSFISPRLACLSLTDLEKFKAEHLAEIESLYADPAILIEFPALFSLAKKPSA